VAIGLSTGGPLITPALFSHRPPPNREKRENSQDAVFNPEGATACSLGLAAFCQPQVKQ